VPVLHGHLNDVAVNWLVGCDVSLSVREYKKELFDHLFEYDRSNGNLIWKERPRSMFGSNRGHNTWNARHSGSVAGTPTGNGYVCITIDYNRHLAHRIVWALHNGSTPIDMQIDHINGVRADNRIENLRLATGCENRWNRGMRPENTSGYKGVSYHKQTGKWVAQIGANLSGTIYLGLHDTAEDAHAAYCKASADLHGEFSKTQ